MQTNATMALISNQERTIEAHSIKCNGTLTRAIVRALQFVVAIAILGIYGSDLCSFPSSFSPSTTRANTDWIFAMVVALLSILTCMIYCFFAKKHLIYIFWDFVMSVLYASLAGTFGMIYLGHVDESDMMATTSLKAMRAGVGFALVAMVLWLISCVQRVMWSFRARNSARQDRRGVHEECEVEFGVMTKDSLEKAELKH
jgi:hypothetical protein